MEVGLEAVVCLSPVSLKTLQTTKNAPNLTKSPSRDDPICTRKISCMLYSYKTKMPEVSLVCNQYKKECIYQFFFFKKKKISTAYFKVIN